MNKLRMAVPKGRLYKEVVRLLSDAGFRIEANGKNYRPYISDPEIEVKIVKAQNIAKLVEFGSQDIGFTGYDWIVEPDADVEQLLDLRLNQATIVAAIPANRTARGLKARRITVASEYDRIARQFLEEEGLDFRLIKTFGATEVFPPEDADMIIDNTSTGQTLRDNELSVVKEICKSTTRLIANKEAMADKWKQQKIAKIKMLVQSVLDGRKRVFIEMNVPKDKLGKIIPLLPCMKSPTISELYGELGYAVKIAVKRAEVPELIPLLKENGVTDILEFKLEKAIL